MDEVFDAGYDGVYLDIVDAYQYWRPRERDVSTEAEMVKFVEQIASYARVTRRHPDYVQAVSGIGKEDLFYAGNHRQPAGEVRWSVDHLDTFKAAGNPVLVTDYVTKKARIDAFYEKAQTHGYVPCATRPRRTYHKPRPRAGLIERYQASGLFLKPDTSKTAIRAPAP